jgi:type VI secretion system protein ImpF
MATGDMQAGVVMSILDRLIDLDPDSKQDSLPNPWEQKREFDTSLCRDLAAILNTRRAEEDFPARYEEATNSLLSFGVTDFTSFDLKSGLEQERVRLSIERAIRKFEPRLERVTVSIEEPDPLKPVLQFQIAALLRVEADAEPVMFDVTLQRESRRLAVSGGGS